MAKKREPIEALIDANVWMRRMDARMPRPLTLDSISDELLAEYGLARGSVTTPSYRCTDPRAALVPIAEITAPVRKLNPDALRNLLRGVRDGDYLPPVVVFRRSGGETAALLDGLHRFHVSRALGFAYIPATRPDLQGCTVPH
jgi:hypothetical protein